MALSKSTKIRFILFYYFIYRKAVDSLYCFTAIRARPYFAAEFVVPWHHKLVSFLRMRQHSRTPVGRKPKGSTCGFLAAEHRSVSVIMQNSSICPAFSGIIFVFTVTFWRLKKKKIRQTRSASRRWLRPLSGWRKKIARFDWTSLLL